MDLPFQLLTTSLKLPIPLIYSLISFIIPIIFINLASNFTNLKKYINKRFIFILYALPLFRFFTDWKSGSLDDQVGSLIFVFFIFFGVLGINIVIAKFVSFDSKKFYEDKKTLILNIILILLLSAFAKTIFTLNLNIDLLSIILVVYLVNTSISKLLEVRKMDFMKYLLVNVIVVAASYIISTWQSMVYLLIQSNWIILLLVGLNCFLNTETIKKLYLQKLPNLE